MSVSLAVLMHSGGSQTDNEVSTFIDGIHSEQVLLTWFRINEIKDQLDVLDEYDGLVFRSIGDTQCAHSEMREFIDAAEAKYRQGAWRNKIATAFLQEGSPTLDDLSALIPYSIFSAQHNMVWVSAECEPRLPNASGAVSENHSPQFDVPEVLGIKAASTKTQAFVFGQQVARVAKSWRQKH